MLIEENLKLSTPKELMKLRKCIAEMLRLADRHLKALMHLREADIFLLELLGEENPHGWIPAQEVKIAEYTKDIELIDAELAGRETNP